MTNGAPAGAKTSNAAEAAPQVIGLEKLSAMRPGEAALAEVPVPEHVQALGAEQQTSLKKLCDLDDEYLAAANTFRDQIKALTQAFEKDTAAPLLAKREAAVKAAKLPNFWLEVIKGSLMTQLVEEHDEQVLAHLEHISKELMEDPDKGLKLHFHFAENAFFSNKVLTLTYHFERTSKWDSDPELKTVEATKVDWKKGKDVTVEEKTKGKGKKKKVKMVPRDSFFRVFYSLKQGGDLPPKVEDPEDEDDDEEDDEERMDELLQDSFEFVSTFKDLILPHAVRHYTGEACPEEDEDDETDEDDDDEDGEDDDDDDDTDDAPNPKKPLLQ